MMKSIVQSRSMCIVLSALQAQATMQDIEVTMQDIEVTMEDTEVTMQDTEGYIQLHPDVTGL